MCEMNDRRQIFAWAMYDWANSAYITTVTVAVLPIYFAGTVVPPDGFIIGGTRYSATTLWAFLISLSTFIIFLTAPVLGAVADFTAAKKRFLMAFCWGGSLFATLLFFCGSGDVWKTMAFFLVAQVGFVGGNVFYDAFLPHIASEDRIDRVSGKGYAYGYLGGGIQFALSLALISCHGALGIDRALAARIAMVSAGLWWAGFSAVTFFILKETGVSEPLPERYRSMPRPLALARLGIDRTVATALRVRRYSHLLLFLVAFMIYDDGIQTVITMATIYGAEEIKLETSVLMITLLIIQFIAIFGALLFSRLGELISAKRALLITLLLWSGVVIYAAWFLTGPVEYMVLGSILGIVLGGSQSLSRSLYGSMIPAQASAEFYGFYSVFSKFSAIFGPLVFGIIRHVSGSSRNAIVSLVVFFLVGMILLSFVDVGTVKATCRDEWGNHAPGARGAGNELGAE
jgi:UMF1 family MFS transporter